MHSGRRLLLHRLTPRLLSVGAPTDVLRQQHHRGGGGGGTAHAESSAAAAATATGVASPRPSIGERLRASSASHESASATPAGKRGSIKKRMMMKKPHQQRSGGGGGLAASDVGDDLDSILAGVSTAGTATTAAAITPPLGSPSQHSHHHHQHHDRHRHQQNKKILGHRSDSVSRGGGTGEEVVFDETQRVSSPALGGVVASGTRPGAGVVPIYGHHRALSDLSPLELTRRSLNIGETVTSGAANASLEQIERRRSKYSVSDTEMDVGITERLFPELRRLPALHEVHYGDAVVREVDSATYFSALERQEQQLLGQGNNSIGINNGNDEDDEFARFDAEVGTVTAASAENTESASISALDGTNTTTSDSAVAATEEEEAVVLKEEVTALTIAHGTQRPWFVDALCTHDNSNNSSSMNSNGAVRLNALPPADCLLLLNFVLHLRNQTLDDLPRSVQRKAAAAAAVTESSDDAGSTSSNSINNSHSSRRKQLQQQQQQLSLADVIRYLDTAPAPVIGLTENLHNPSSSSSSSLSSSSLASASSTTTPPPAFIFTLYMENVSLTNALSHLATLFAIPIKCFHTHSVPSKMSCAAIACAVERGRLRREHLLLINTLRLPGFVLRVGDLREITDNDYSSSSNDHRDDDDNDDAAAKTNEDPSEPSSAAATPPAPPAQQQPSGAAVTAKNKNKQTTTTTMTAGGGEPVFGQLARWDPLFEAEVLVRRISATNKEEIDHRLRAARDVGAVFFTATREASLARAATDILHGFYKSAVINALHRPKAPLAVKQFIARPNPVTASRARRASTDATVRQVLRAFIATNGDWRETVRRTPFDWRHRWLTTLRALVWNKMASRRVRVGGRSVLVGDVVVRPEFRADVQRRLLTTIKSEHVKLVATAAETAECSLEDVFIPFLRGGYPPHLFAPESTSHPIMTESGMIALLRENHAPQLLLGLPDEARLLLDARGDSGALLWRRLITRPVAMEFEVLEDKAPMRSVHFDAARILGNDRWACTAGGPSSNSNSNKTVTASASSSSPASRYASQQQQQQRATEQNDDNSGTSSSSSPSPSDVLFATDSSALLPQSTILERTTIGARLHSGVLAEEFFSIPSSDNYVVLGQSQRNLGGSFVPARPATAEGQLSDRLFTIHIRAMTRTGIAGLTQVLREYFILGGVVEQESDSALQHKIHRIRRELDPETPLLTAPSYCEVCYSRDHDDADACAEYFFKRNKHSNEKMIEESLRAQQRRHKQKQQHLSQPSTLGEGSGFGKPMDAAAAGKLDSSSSITTTPTKDSSISEQQQQKDFTLHMELRLRRGQGQKWGVNMTKSLRLTGLDDVTLVKAAAVTIASGLDYGDSNSDNKKNNSIRPNGGGVAASGGEGETWPPEVLLAMRKRQMMTRGGSGSGGGGFEELQRTRRKLGPVNEKTVTTADAAMFAAVSANVQGLLCALMSPGQLQRLTVAAAATTTPATLPLLLLDAETEATTSSLSSSSATPSVSADATIALSAKFMNAQGQLQTNALLRGCDWRLSAVDEEGVADRGDVAAAFARRTRQLEVRMTFTTAIRVGGDDNSDDGSMATTTPTTPALAAGSNNMTVATKSSTDAAAAAAAVDDEQQQQQQQQRRQRWMRDLPDTLSVILTKTLAEASSQDPRVASWGVRLHTRDMTFVNFSTILAKATATATATLAHDSSSSPSSTAMTSKNVAPLHVRVAVTPPEVIDVARELFIDSNNNVSGEDDSAEAVFGAALAPLLDAAYNVTRINGIVVTTKQAAAGTLNTFRQKLLAKAIMKKQQQQQQQQQSNADSGDEADAVNVHLPLVLRRRPDSYGPSTETNAAAAIAELSSPPATPDDSSAVVAAAVAAAEVARADTTAATTTTPPPPPEKAVNQQYQRMTAEQQHASIATLAINRLVISASTAGRWGLKIQKSTLRLKYIQFNRLFTFQVYTAKRNHAVRMQDTLRFLPQSASTSTTAMGSTAHQVSNNISGEVGSSLVSVDPATSTTTSSDNNSNNSGGGGVKLSFSYYAYMIDAVNHEKVVTFDGLRTALHAAALPHDFAKKKLLEEHHNMNNTENDVDDGDEAATTTATLDEEDEDGGGGVTVPKKRNTTTNSDEKANAERAALLRGPEAVTLGVRQFRLARVTVTIKRGGGAGEPSPLAPVGLSINSSLVILGVERGSPMATAIAKATRPGQSSLRGLIGQRASASAFSNIHGRGKGSSDSSRDSDGGGGVVVPFPLLASALDAVLVAAGLPPTRRNDSVGDDDDSSSKAATTAAAQQKRAWQYDIDEDDQDSTSTTTDNINANSLKSDEDADTHASSSSLPSTATATALNDSAMFTALTALLTATQAAREELRSTVAVDGVFLLQASLLGDFAASQFHSLRHNNTNKKKMEEELKDLLSRLSEVHDEVCWRVIYAAKAGTTLRTTQEVAQAIAPGVAEESLVLQQCLAAW